MARSRNIKPGFFLNETLVEMPFETRLLFAGLPCIADREGRLDDRPKKIKMQLFPADNVDIDGMLDTLHVAGFIIRYTVQGSEYIQVVNFSKHQNPHKAEKGSIIPAPDDDVTSTVQAPDKHSSNRADSFNSDSLNLSREGAAVAADPPKQKRKTQFPHEHLPADWQAYCTEKRPDLDPQRVFESCRDYHLGHGKVMLDWLRTWQRWVRETHQAPQAVNGTAHTPKAQEWKPPQTLVDELVQKFGKRPVDSALAGHCVNERQFRGFVRDKAQPHWTELAKAN